MYSVQCTYMCLRTSFAATRIYCPLVLPESFKQGLWTTRNATVCLPVWKGPSNCACYAWAQWLLQFCAQYRCSFTFNIAGPCPAAQERNEQWWRSCTAPPLQPSTLSHIVVSSRRLHTMPAWVTSMLHSSSIYCWLSGNWRAWAGLGVKFWNNSAVTSAFRQVSRTNLHDHTDLSTQVDNFRQLLQSFGCLKLLFPWPSYHHSSLLNWLARNFLAHTPYLYHVNIFFCWCCRSCTRKQCPK